jgi:hypothetical protein
MSDIEDTNDAWWHAQETDERWRRHNELRDELTELTKELKNHESIRTDCKQVSIKIRL